VLPATVPPTEAGVTVTVAISLFAALLGLLLTPALY